MRPGGRLHRFWLGWAVWSITLDGTITWWSTDDVSFRERKVDAEIQLPRWPWRVFCRGQHSDYYGECVFCKAPMPGSPYATPWPGSSYERRVHESGGAWAAMSERWDPDWTIHDWTIHPGATLRDWREENGLPVTAAATCCARMPVEMYEAIEAGKRRITKVIADGLAHGTGISASFWLDYERLFRADLKAGRKWEQP